MGLLGGKELIALVTELLLLEVEVASPITKQVIRDTAQQYVKANRPCLEACLKRLAKSFETFVVSV